MRKPGTTHINGMTIKEYYKIHNKKYRDTHKEQLQEYRRKRKEVMSANNKRWYKTHYDKVTELYSRGTMLCPCGGQVEEHHHADPNDGDYERKLFKSTVNSLALKYQINMFDKNPNYIVPMCAKCHTEIHIKLRPQRPHRPYKKHKDKGAA